MQKYFLRKIILLPVAVIVCALFFPFHSTYASAARAYFPELASASKSANIRGTVSINRYVKVNTVWDAYGLFDQYSGSTAPTAGTVATLTMPVLKLDVEGVSFLTTTSNMNILGDLTGKTVSAQISISATKNPIFVFGYEGQSWNTCPAPANVRLYFTTTVAPYDLNNANDNETEYWWADTNAGSATVANGLNATLTASLADPSQWSDSQGNSGSNPNYTAAFLSAVKNVRQIGLAYGGGCFYDTGVGLQTNGASAQFDLLNYKVY